MRRAGLLLAVILAACGDDAAGGDGGRRDAGARADADLPPVPVEPAPPAAPAAPMFEPCPDGWRAITDAGGLVTCDPWPEGGAVTDCPAGEMHFPGTPGCAPVGPPCPAGPWADDLPATGVFFVQAGAAAGGDGSRAAPFATIAEALPRVSVGGRIALAKGTYDEEVLLNGAVLHGACAAETIVSRGSGPARSDAVITAHGRFNGLRSLTVRSDGTRIGVLTETFGAMTMAGVVVEQADAGVLVSLAGSLEADALVVRDTRDAGVQVENRSTARLTRVAVERATRAAFFVIDPEDEMSTLEVDGAVVRGTRPDPTGGAAALGMSPQSTAVLRALVVEDSAPGAIISAGDLTVEASLFRGNRALPMGGDAGGCGIAVSGGPVTLRRVVVEGSEACGVTLIGGDTVLTAEDLVVRRILPIEGLRTIGGLVAQDGATLNVHRALVEGSVAIGVVIAGATLDATDLVVRGTRPDAVVPTLGHGIQVGFGGLARLERVALLDNRSTGLFVGLAGSRAVATDLRIAGTRPVVRGDGRLHGGFGVHLQDGGDAELTRVAVDDSVAIGISLNAGTLTLRDGVVTGTAGQTDTGEYGVGLHVVRGSVATVERLRVAGSHTAGIYVHGGGSSLMLGDVRVEDTLAAECASGPCAGRGYGSGLIAITGATVSASRFVLSRSALAGLHVVDAGDVSAEGGLITDSLFGIAADDPDLDLGRLLGGIAFQGNEDDVATTTLPVPEPLDTVLE